ncbi:uncharacterized protein LOC132552807 [Ylistrum balloti]|uniref:uncharacterized protein LOC132552807 n=1 Tax=Ylistrum balloti TaxID=509963 RepID=UPI002905B3A9|nr:uncharacterized protein LOC132552807 [Ylistrum balloti]
MWMYVYMCCSFVIHPVFSSYIDHEDYKFYEGQYGFTRYRLLLDKYKRNTAYEICQLYGGNLIRPDSIQKLQRLIHLNKAVWQFEMHHDFWIDLVREPDTNTFTWTSDCTALDPSTDWHCMLPNFDDNPDKLCIVSKHGNYWNSKNCDSDAMVICETLEIGNPCSYGSSIKYPMISMENFTIITCHEKCISESNCWAYTFFQESSSPGTCAFHYDASKETNPLYAEATTKLKYCYDGELVEAIDQTWSIGTNGDLDVPIYNCTSNTLTYFQPYYLSLDLYNDTCSTMTVTNVATLTVTDMTTNSMTVFITESPTTVVTTIEIPTTVLMTTVVITTEIPSQLVTTIVSTEVATTTVEVSTTIAITSVIPASNVTITITPSTVPITTVVSSEVITTTAEVPTTITITETPSVIISTVAVTVAATSTVIVPTTVVHSEVETLATTVLMTTTVHDSTWSTVSPLASAELSQRLENIVKNLTVPKKSTNAYQRKLVCAEDSRLSAMSLGYVGVMLLLIPLAILLCFDIPSAVVHIKKLRDSLRR